MYMYSTDVFNVMQYPTSMPAGQRYSPLFVCIHTQVSTRSMRVANKTCDIVSGFLSVGHVTSSATNS